MNTAYQATSQKDHDQKCNKRVWVVLEEFRILKLALLIIPIGNTLHTKKTTRTLFLSSAPGRIHKFVG